MLSEWNDDDNNNNNNPICIKPMWMSDVLLKKYLFQSVKLLYQCQKDTLDDHESFVENIKSQMIMIADKCMCFVIFVVW